VCSIVLVAGILGGLTLVPGAAAEEPIVELVEPADGAVVGARPVFRLDLPTTDESEFRALRLRLRIRSEAIGGPEFVNDRSRGRAGWTLGEAGTMLFRPPRPIPDGSYVWSVEFWNGTSWVGAVDRSRFRVDTIPPAPVANLRAVRDPERGVIRLEWDAVTADVEGGAEFVARYHVYRYPRANGQRLVPAFEVASTDETRIELPYDVADPEQGRWFLRVTAEDLAGNEAETPPGE